MKTKSSLPFALVAITAMILTPQTARAGHREDKIFAAVGGLIGGVIIGKNIERNRQPTYHHQPESRVIVVQSHSTCPPPPRGYWQETRTKVWVASCWTETRNEWGHRVKVWQPGHYTYQTTRVWVSGGNGYAGYYDNHYTQPAPRRYSRY